MAAEPGVLLTENRYSCWAYPFDVQLDYWEFGDRVLLALREENRGR